MLIQSLRNIISSHKSCRLLLIRVRGVEKRFNMSPDELYIKFEAELDDVKFMLLGVID